NYGLDKQIEHDLRYDRAEEWVQVVRKLWRSWDADAIVSDAAAGVFADFSKVHTIDHKGEFFQVRGPLNTAPLAEEPVMVQAGASGKGQDFAGRNSDVVLALASTPERMRAHREGIREVAAAHGRNPNDIKVLFVVNPILTANAEETASVRARRSELTQAAIDEALQGVSYLSGVDFKKFDLDEALPELTTNSNQGTLDNFVKSAPAGSTLREILQARANKDGLAIIGSGEEVAEHLGELSDAVGGDGFLFTGQVHPAHVHRTLDPLVPALRRRGLLRTELGDGGLRANLADF
ncbi:MAG: soxA, partial [Glaciihabitans sp.]|nr:soxA [Glaciihabitans sp.]